MIQSFADRETEKVWNGIGSKRLSMDVANRALVKLRLLHGARSLEDLRVPPGNRLERLKGDRGGQYSIRIIDQWRVCFRWREGGAHDVEIVNYH